MRNAVRVPLERPREPREDGGRRRAFAEPVLPDRVVGDAGRARDIPQGRRRQIEELSQQ